MNLRQSLSLVLFVAGFVLSAPTLLLVLGVQDFIDLSRCELVDPITLQCLEYSGSFVRVIYTEFVSVGQKFMYITVPIGLLLIFGGIIVTQLNEPMTFNLRKKN